ncbi:MAG: trigger factor [bacterium]|nr:trigger factor [bacterium]
MEIEKREKDGCKIVLGVRVEKEVVEEEFNKSFERLSKHARTKGFRKGKVPRSIIESRFSNRAEDDTLETLLRKATIEALEKEGISPIAGPWITKESIDFSKEKPLTFSVELEVEPEFEIPDWRNIKLSRKKVEVKDKDVENALIEIAERKATLIEKISSVENKDIAVIDYVAYLEGSEKKEGFGVYVEVGKKLFPEKLEKELIGMRVNEKKSFKAKMPSQTRDTSLAGKEVEFSVHLLGIKEKHLPKLSDEFAKEMGCSDMKELKRNVEEELQRTAESIMRTSLKNQMEEELLKRCSFPLPPSIVSAQAESILTTIIYNLKKEEKELEDYLASQNKTKEDLRKDITEEATKTVNLFYILNRIGEIEGIECTDTELESWVRLNLAQKHLQETLSNKERRAKLKDELRMEKILDYIIENAK